jgi:hypothetical protein
VVGTVAVYDSSGNPQPVKPSIPIEANGHYSVDVSGLKAPFAFLASGTVGGRPVSLYSAATKADEGGTINITPFTDLIIRNIAGGAVDAYINNRAYTSITPTQLDDQRKALTNQLIAALEAMELPRSIDFLRDTFNANGAGLDRFMDVVKVSTTPTTATITNILDAAHALEIDTRTGVPISPPLGIANLSPSATPHELIVQTFNNFSNLFASQLPKSDDPKLVALFSSTFLDGGESRSVFLTEITTDPALIGLKFSIVVDSVNDVAGTAQVHLTPRTAAGECLADDVVGCSFSWQMVKVGGVWQADGDRRIAYVRVHTDARRDICNNVVNSNCSPTNTTYTSGLNLDVDNRGLRPIGSAVVTGPGLPAQGVTLISQANQTWLSIVNPTQCPDCRDNRYVMTDTDIAKVLPNSTYTVQLYDNAAPPVLLATYTEVVPVAPVLNTALPTLPYPSITSGMQNLAGITNATLTLSWTIPPGLKGGGISVNVNQPGPTPGSGPSLNIRVDFNGGTVPSGTSTLVLTAPPTGAWVNGGYDINSYDQHGGEVSTQYR